MKKFLLLSIFLFGCNNQDTFHETSDGKLYFKDKGKLYLVENKIMTEVKVSKFHELNEQFFSVVEDSIQGYGGLRFLGFIKYFNNSLNYTIKINSKESNKDIYYNQLKNKSGSQFTIQFVDKFDIVIVEKPIYGGFIRIIEDGKLQYLKINGSLDISLEEYILVRGINVTWED